MSRISQMNTLRLICEIRTTNDLDVRRARRIHVVTGETKAAGFTTEDAEVRREVNIDSVFPSSAILCALCG